MQVIQFKEEFGMIKLVVGKKGSGKTKTMLDAIAEAVKNESGNVIFVCNSNRHMLEVTHAARLVDVSEADTETFRLFKTFIMGMLSQNYDISHIFIDSLFKIVPDDAEGLADFVNKLEAISEKSNVKFTICISADKSELPESVYKYI
jgi:RecA/RadA recombinase